MTWAHNFEDKPLGLPLNPAPRLIAWYEKQGRPLPWRLTRDPYKIWISEIILQQTRVAQGHDYYLRFIARFPDVHALAGAPAHEVLKQWEGLGYYSRARNLHATAQHIVSELGGEFPRTVEGLLQLKGIGPYTARAIASLAFGVNTAVVDGNVLRVVARYAGSARPINHVQTRNYFQEMLDTWVRGRNAASFNQGIMDLGALVCTPRKPACGDCPIAKGCVALAEEATHRLPVKEKKAPRKVKHYYFYLVTNEKGAVLVQQRPASGLWASLWEIPNEEVKEGTPYNKRRWKKLGTFSHAFTHFDMEGTVLSGTEKPPCGENARFMPRGKMRIFAFPKAVLNLFERFLPQFSSKLHRSWPNTE